MKTGLGKAFIADDERFFWVEPSTSLRDLTIAKTQRDYRVMVAMGGRLTRIPNSEYGNANLGELCISVLAEGKLIPTVFTDVPLWDDMQWFLEHFKPKGISGRLIDISPSVLEELFEHE